MKTAAVLVATAALVSATPGGLPPGAKVNCAKANANYCMDGNIILRCNGEAIGTREVCSERMAGGDSVAGAGAVCQQSGKEAGDAICKVMNNPGVTGSATIPEGTTTGTPMPPPASSGMMSIPEGSMPTPPASESGIMSIPEGSLPAPPSSESGIMSIPEGTSLGTAPVPTETPTKLTNPIRTESSTETDECPAPTDSPAPTMPGGDHPPTGSIPGSTTAASSVPTAAANAKQAGSVFAAAGFVAALFL